MSRCLIAVGRLTSMAVCACVLWSDGKDPPLLPDDQYPSWLFEMRVRGGTARQAGWGDDVTLGPSSMVP